jgi:protein-tyrosine-phosphatase
MAGKLPGTNPLVACSASRVQPNGQPPPGLIGNTTGMIVPDTAPNPKPNTAPVIKPTEKEKGWWERWGSGAVHIGLDVVGLIPGVGEIADGANALIYLAEGDKVNAALSAAAMIPGAGMAATGAKYAKKAAGVAVEAGAKLSKEAAEKLAKEAAEKAAKEKAEKEAAEAAAKKKGGKDKGKKKKLDCGELGTYGDRKKRIGDNKYDRDHVPSKGALKERAAAIAKERGEKLSEAQAKAIENLADAIVIPKSTHRNSSPSYGSKNKKLSKKDGVSVEKLNEALDRDLDAVLADLEKTDPECAKQYRTAAKKLRDKIKKNLNHFDDFLSDVLDNF